MADRDQRTDRPSPSPSAPRRDDDAHVPPDPKVGRPTNSESEESTPSRPHGTTEDPDRTL